LELQPARKSAICSPGWKIGFGDSPVPEAALLAISSKSRRTQPTLETSISPSSAIQKTLGTVVRPYAFEAG
jgi:hypothetical protein